MIESIIYSFTKSSLRRMKRKRTRLIKKLLPFAVIGFCICYIISYWATR